MDESQIKDKLRQQLLEYGYIAWFAARHAEDGIDISVAPRYVTNVCIVLDGLKSGEVAPNNLSYYAEKLLENDIFLDQVKKSIHPTHQEKLKQLTDL